VSALVLVMTQLTGRSVRDLGIVSTLVDAVVAFARGRPKAGALLLGAAALSARIPGLGVAVSVLLRVYRKLA
jgi:hypothetical protein